MASLNKAFLIGNITKDIELKYIPSGTAVVNFSIAVNEVVKEEKKAHFINCVAYSKTAENLSKYCGKGSPILVEGKINTRSYEASDGSRRHVVEVICNNIQFLGSKKESTRPQAQSDDFHSKDFSQADLMPDNDLTLLYPE